MAHEYNKNTYAKDILDYVGSKDIDINNIVNGKEFTLSTYTMGADDKYEYTRIWYDIYSTCYICMAVVGIRKDSSNKVDWPTQQENQFILGHLNDDWNLVVDKMYVDK